MPFSRGSAAVAEWVGKALSARFGISLGASDVILDLKAFSSSPETFAQNYFDEYHPNAQLFHDLSP